MAFLKSARSVETVNEVGYHRCDRGLYLQVARSGTKSWLFRYKSPVTAKQREMGLGSLNLVSLAAARDIAVECRRQVLSGLDPIEERGRIKSARHLEQARSITFQEAAEHCIASKKPEWKNAKHAQQWGNSLATYAYPVFGTLPVSDLDTDLVLKAIEPIWISKTETASRVRQRIETVWDWARARKYVEGENPARLRGHLDKILTKTMNAVLMAGANYMWHSAGWNEAGMHCSTAKFIVDAEMCEIGYRMAQGVNWDDFDAALSAVTDIGPSGHYLGHPHTLEHFQEAFFMPEMFDNNSIEQWHTEGGVEINERALNKARAMLNEYEEPKLDDGVNEALLDYIARREREIPAADALNKEH